MNCVVDKAEADVAVRAFKCGLFLCNLMQFLILEPLALDDTQVKLGPKLLCRLHRQIYRRLQVVRLIKLR